jgi:soluble lytic murein transglycosylase-like protein
MKTLLSLLTLLTLLLWLPTPTPALTADADPAGRWRDYKADAARLKPALRFPFHDCFRQAAERHGVPETLLLAVARGESNFDPKAVSSANAVGLMQIRWPQTARHLGIERRAALLDACTNVDAGARYLKELLQRYDGDLHLSLAAYNYGPGRIAPGASRLPEGALWYSGYILRHLDYVVAEARNGPTPGDYSAEQRLEIIRFARPYRAAALVETLQRRRPGLRLDVFRRTGGDFSVMLLYLDADERDTGLRALRALGLAPS